MVSIAVMAGVSLVIALAFFGTNYLFGKLGGAEGERHDLTMEQLSKARAKHSQNRQQWLDFINKTIQQQRHAEQTFRSRSCNGRILWSHWQRATKVTRPARAARFLRPERGTKR